MIRPFQPSDLEWIKELADRYGLYGTQWEDVDLSKAIVCLVENRALVGIGQVRWNPDLFLFFGITDHASIKSCIRLIKAILIANTHWPLMFDHAHISWAGRVALKLGGQKINNEIVIWYNKEQVYG